MSGDSELEALREEADRLELHGLSRELTLRALERNPDDWELLDNLTVHELTFGRYTEAARAHARAEQLCPPKALKWMWSRKGQISAEMGDHEKAEAHFLTAHAIDPQEATFLIFAASSAFRSGDLKKAIRLVTRATKCSKGCIDEAWFNLGGFLMADRRYSRAKNCYMKALRLDPNYKLAKTRLEDVERILALNVCQTKCVRPHSKIKP